ncbi:siroheme synthase [Altererythrobacter sp. B11]|uniref:precorrin-2 dehydrogenase/sirohydrochlorin ferrochelatase family protein n=1 Tax=Altererythrobacter sp. B11 TaxID=2060312 RepID=UPI000DC6EA8B|nr:NAD(P)-dependent oxidoreductase [Altererythrobacter sp. B11]BBC72259.1 siroheme synthase [Altererythrobacter sp. B11]
MRSLPLFHRIAGQAVIVLGDEAGAEPKWRLVERAGGKPVGDLEEGLARGARLAFVAYASAEACEAAAARLRAAGALVNVVDRPDLCDFTVPSILERDPVLLAVGTSGASAGLAKQLRLRLEALLPSRLGALALGLQEARGALRARWPGAGERRRVLDAALGAGGPLDPLDDASADRLPAWLAAGAQDAMRREIEFEISGDDPDDLTLRQARWLGTADHVLFDAAIAPAILDRARADAQRHVLPCDSGALRGSVVILRRPNGAG